MATQDGGTSDMTYPDWDGPAVHGRNRPDGGLQVDLIASTGGHRFALNRVAREGAVADVFVHYASPDGAVVTQVITTHSVEVSAAKIGDSRTVRVWVERPGDEARLAIVMARPVR